MQAYRGPLGERLVVTGRIGDLLRYKQTLTLWHDVARVECRTTVDEFTGADRLLRLRWPCPVPGALPVSEVGDAVIGRGFGLMHEGGGESAVDSAIHPWTLDNPAYGWFGLSSAVRVRVGATRGARGVGGRGGVAVGVGVGPAGASVDGRARPRRGHRDLQRRRPPALRRSRRRLQPARRTDRARRSGPECLHRSGFGAGRSGLCRGARAPALVNRPRQGMGAAQCAVGRRVGPGRGSAPGACAAGARHRRIGPRGRGGFRRRGPRRLRDRRRPGGAISAGALRVVHRRGAQPRNARIRRRFRRHPAHLADALVHRLAVGHLDRPAAAHRTRRVQLPAAALDAHLRVRGRLRRRRLASGGHTGAQCGVLAPATGRHRKQQRRRRVAGVGDRCWRSSPRARCNSGR